MADLQARTAVAGLLHLLQLACDIVTMTQGRPSRSPFVVRLAPRLWLRVGLDLTDEKRYFTVKTDGPGYMRIVDNDRELLIDPTLSEGTVAIGDQEFRIVDGTLETLRCVGARWS